ncbi:MAG: hypothetical protein AB7L09_00390 [Nitrospira sp.]
MSKRIYVLLWTDGDGVAHVDGYWSRPLSDEEQHGFFKEHYPRDYDPCGGRRCDITWEMVELKGLGNPVPLPNHIWSNFEPEW